MQYKKITQDDVYRILVNMALDIMSPINLINISNIAGLLKTSRYQVKKYINLMVKDGVAELKFEMLYDEMMEISIPYWGYRLTAKGKDTEFYRAEDKRHAEIIKECFNLDEDIDSDFEKDIF